MRESSLLSRLLNTLRSIVTICLVLFFAGVGGLFGKAFFGGEDAPAGPAVPGASRNEVAGLLGISREDYDARMEALRQETKGMSARESQLAALEAASREMNKSLPELIDEVTRRERTSTGPGLTINFEHTVLREYRTEADRRQFEVHMTDSIKSVLCGQQGVLRMLDAGGAYRYTYHSERGGLLADVRITKSDCR